VGVSDQLSCPTLGAVSTWMGDHRQIGKPSQYVTCHPAQLSLAIPPCVGARSISKSQGINRHTAQCICPMSMVSQWKLASGRGPYGLGRTSRFYHSSAITHCKI